jgi:hypothetical protein
MERSAIRGRPCGFAPLIPDFAAPFRWVRASGFGSAFAIGCAAGFGLSS